MTPSCSRMHKYEMSESTELPGDMQASGSIQRRPGRRTLGPNGGTWPGGKEKRRACLSVLGLLHRQLIHGGVVFSATPKELLGETLLMTQSRD